jgi:hypothetical protein
MPAPISLNSAACSITCTGMPLRDSASAVERPAIPPPTIRTGELSLVVLTDYSSEIERGIETV